MRAAMIGSSVLGLVLAIPSPAHAQRRGRTPHTESTAVGFDVGAFAPSLAGSKQLDNAPEVSGLYEYYLTPRASIRVSAGWSNPSIKNSSTDSVRMIPLRMDLNYNWEKVKWHPFVGAGVGAYFLQYQRSGQAIGESGTNFGVNFGGGIEYFFTRTASIKGEARYHAINDYRGIDPSGLEFTAGLKTYF